MVVVVASTGSGTVVAAVAELVEATPILFFVPNPSLYRQFGLFLTRRFGYVEILTEKRWKT
jgi:hypothetical protein